jgi:hypothetical protein
MKKEEDINIDQKIERLLNEKRVGPYPSSLSKWKFSSYSATFGEDILDTKEEAEKLREWLDPLEFQVLKFIEKAEEADCLISKYEYIREMVYPTRKEETCLRSIFSWQLVVCVILVEERLLKLSSVRSIMFGV